MQLTIKGKQIDIGNALKSHIEENITASVEKYFDNTTDASVTISKEAHNFTADIQVHITKRIMVQGSGSGGDAYAAFEEANEHVAKRLRRYKRRLNDHKHRGNNEVLMAQHFVLQAEPNIHSSAPVENEPDNPIIIAEMSHEIETLSVSDAVMRMDLAHVSALMFRNIKDNKLNMVYMRQDGNIGWVDPQDKN
jgi:ribosomal subunit interface protein